MSQYKWAKIFLFAFLLFCGKDSIAQLPTTGLVYFKKGLDIYNYDPLLPVSATNPVVNTIHVTSTTCIGLAISPVLGSGSTTLTYYTVNMTSGFYEYYDPVTSAWVSTGHLPGNPSAVNIAPAGPYLFNLVGATGDVYRYDGTGPGTLIATVPGFRGVGPYDLVGDCEGNWYIFNQSGTEPFLKKYSSTGTLLHTWVYYNPLGLRIAAGAGFAIIDTILYTDDSWSGGGIAHYSLGKDTVTVLGTTSDPKFAGADDFGTASSVRPVIRIKAAPGNKLCLGTAPVTFTTTTIKGGTAPTYQWMINGNPVGGNTPSYTYSPANGDQVCCILTSSAACADPATVSSDTIKMAVYDPLKPPTPVSPLHYCRWVGAPPLTAKVSVAGNQLYWYSAATGGTGSLTAPSPATTTSGTFTYYVSEGNGDCESPRVPITVVIYDAVTISDVSSGSPTTCGGLDGFIRFKASKSFEVYKVNYDKNGLPQPTLTFTSDVSGYITISGLANGTYTAITITDSRGCVSPPFYGPIELKGPVGPAPPAANNGPVCEGDLVLLSTGIVAGTTYQWSGPAGFSSTEHNPSFTATEEAGGTYTLVTTRDGCVSAPARTILVVAKLPKKQNHPDQIICEGSDLYVEQYKELYTEYEWTNDAGDFKVSSPVLSRKQVQLNQGGAYLLKAETEFGCVMQDTILVLVDPKTSLSVSKDTALCLKDTIILVALSNTQTVSWTPSKGIAANSKTPRVSPAESTTYTVVAKSDHEACADVSAKVTVRVLALPEVAAMDTTVRMNIPYQIVPVYSSNIVQWQWLPSDSLSCSNCATPTFNSSREMNYTVKVMSSEGCMNTDQVRVKVFCDGANVTMPNAFTPNGDGVNDVFYVRGQGFTVKSFNIYNRLGQLVFSRDNFHPNDMKFGWDGTLNGQAVSDVAGFVYTLEAVCLNSTNAPMLIKGTVLMIR
ncbi:MAG: gliding motility-associated C-terminal domain-containing protein [Chitinophagaceae bacterium]|nr:gliding motility-associated C-terminal domain-containing protein [Chitinophagaceae bacterium]